MLQLAVVGTNYITDRFTEAASRAGGYALHTVCSRSRERGEAYRQRFGYANAVTNIADVAADSGVDIVYLGTPNSLHYEQAKICLSAGKHVVVEKPAFSLLRETEELVALAAQKGVFLFEAIRVIHHPHLRLVKEQLQQIGPVRYAYFNFMKYSSHYDEYRAGQIASTFSPVYSGGGLYDLGVYCLANALYLFGFPQASHFSAVKLASGVDGVGTLLLEYDGFLCVLSSGKISNSQLDNEIQGENGTILFESTCFQNIRLINQEGTKTVATCDYGSHGDMFLEADAFARIIRENDRKAYDELTQYLLWESELLERSRRQADIVFAVDQI